MQQQLMNIVQGDFGFFWKFTLTDAQGVVVDISNADLFFEAQLVSDLAVQFRNPMAVISPTAGTCKYTVLDTDFVVPGTYQGQIVVEYNAGEIITFSGITIEVEPSLPVA